MGRVSKAVVADEVPGSSAEQTTLSRKQALNGVALNPETLSSDEKDVALVAALREMMTAIKNHDPAPTVLGIAIKPTLLRLIGAYVVSAASVVIGKLFSG